MLGIDFGSMSLIYTSLAGLFVSILASKIIVKLLKKVYTND